jgi:ribosomal protein S18 acetylase RimI-like enzyme
VRDRYGSGAIQNLGVTPLHRERGIGSALILQALHGFRRAGLGRVFLEVTATNDTAVRLYRRLGFGFRKTVYKAVEAAPAFS